MGREAQGPCTIGRHTEPVKALLESTELIVRGSTHKRRFALAQLQAVRVEGPALRFEAESHTVSLELGAEEAQKWLKKMLAPPPTLAAKLGISDSSPAWVLGPVDDDTLQAALHGATASRTQDAAVLLVVARRLQDLEAAMAQHTTLPCKHLWVVHEKGPGAALGDGDIRTHLRARGYRDNKTSAVSARLTATRYARPE